MMSRLVSPFQWTNSPMGFAVEGPGSNCSTKIQRPANPSAQSARGQFVKSRSVSTCSVVVIALPAASAVITAELPLNPGHAASAQQHGGH